MPAKDLGTKYICFKCATKFYDLKKPDPLCPKCGTDQRESPANKPVSEGRRGRLAAVPKVVEPVEPVEETAEVEEAEEELESLEDEEVPSDDEEV
ncbi:MAG: TIGR02300 family protein [Myxococcota bacterium]